MSVNEDRVVYIVKNNILDNVICRALEFRPTELAKYICGLANNTGGYIFLGVEKQNGYMKKLGCQKTFNVAGVIEMIKAQLDNEVAINYGFVSVDGVDIFAIEVAQSDKKIWLDGKCFLYRNNDIEEIIGNQNGDLITLFISYTECDTPIVDIIENKIKEKLRERIRISRYTQLQYKDGFKAFMNTIQDHDFVLTVVSDTYLKSQACMYEVGEIIKDQHYKDRLLFVVLSQNERKYYGNDAPEKIDPDIYKGAGQRLEYVDYWKRQYENLERKMREINDFEAVSKASVDLKIIGQIFRKDMGEFLEFLSDENGKSFDKLYLNDFDEIIAWLELK